MRLRASFILAPNQLAKLAACRAGRFGKRLQPLAQALRGGLADAPCQQPGGAVRAFEPWRHRLPAPRLARRLQSPLRARPQPPDPPMLSTFRAAPAAPP